MKNFLSCLTLLIVLFPAFAQQGTWVNYSEFTNNVKCVTIDEQGNKWFGTTGGLTKFDGNTWTTYTKFNSGLKGDTIISITIDAAGNKWIGTDGGGLSIFNGSSWTTYTKTNSPLTHNTVKEVKIDRDGNKWIGTYGGGLLKFDGSNWTVYNEVNSGLSNNYVSCVAIDKANNVWVGTNTGVTGIYKFNGTSWTNYKSSNSNLVHPYVYDITPDKYGNVWIAADVGVSKFDGTTFTNYTTTDTKTPWFGAVNIVIDDEDNKWVGTGDGFFKFDNQVWSNYHRSTNTFLRNPFICLAIDKNGHKWFGPKVTEYDGAKLILHDANDKNLPFNGIRSFAKDPNGGMWVGTDGKGLSFFNGTSWVTYNYDSGYLNDFLVVNNIVIDKANTKWLGTNRGLYKFSPPSTAQRFSSTSSGIWSDGVYALALDASEVKWVSTAQSVLHKFDGTRWTLYWDLEYDGESLVIDKQGNKWLGTSRGLAKFNGSSWTTYTKANSGLVNDDINCLMLDKEGALWIGTYGGISRFDGTNWVSYTRSNSGLVSDVVSAIAEDGKGNKWIGTFYDGLFSFDGTNWKNYTVANTNKGLTENFIQAVAVDGAGKIWVGTRKMGVSVFSPEGTMPVVISTFQARASLSGNLLNWSTANELNNRGFEIERSTEAANFRTIAFQAAKGAGSSYQFTDYSPLPGDNYYRLKQLDHNGAFSYSDILHVRFSAAAKNDLSVFPNPCRNELTVSVSKNNTTIVIYNAQGTVVMHVKNADAGQMSLDVSHLTPGAYILKTDLDETKFVKAD